MSEHLTASDLDSLKAKIAVSNLIGEEDVVAKLLSAYESLQADVEQLRKVIQYNFCLNPDTSDGTELIGREMMPMPDNVRLTIIAECMRAEAAARAAGEEK